MALPSTGAISLTDVQTEFGGVNPASLSEYYAGGLYVPAGTTGTNGAVPSSGAISLNLFHGTAAGFTYWQQAQTSNDGFSAGSVGVDSSGNYYSAMNSSGNLGTFNKVASLGTNQFTRRFSSSVRFNRMVTAPSGNTYIVGVSGSNGVLVKYNSSGVLQWQRNIISGAAGAVSLDDVCLDPSENVYIGGIDTGNTSMFIMCSDTTGARQWGRQMTVTGVTPEARMALTYYSSTSTGICFAFIAGASGPTAILAGTYTLAGVSTGQVSFASPTRTLGNNYIGVTYIGINFLFAFSSYNTGASITYQQYISFNTTFNWQKELTTGGLSANVNQVATDGTNFYSAGYTTSGVTYAKISSAGTITAQKTIVGVTTTASGVAASSTDLAFGASVGTGGSHLYKAPFTMAFGTNTGLSEATSDWTGGGITITDAAGTQTSAGSPYTEASFAGSYTLTQLT